ncbi:MAG: SufE family protein [Fibrobacter sp.]|mgnify:FL=1|nr:SufE family protein [Fibrobacter sp.]
MNIDQIQDTIIKDFNQFPDWFTKYEYLINLGKNYPSQDPSLKSDQYALPGCQSQVWIDVLLHDDDRVYFRADSDSIIIRGILSLLIKTFNGQIVSDVINSKIYFLQKMGLITSLSPTRANGINSILKRMLLLAKKLKKK